MEHSPQSSIDFHGNGPVPKRETTRTREPQRASARDLLCPLRRAVELHLRGDFEGAERRLRAVLELEPRLAQAHHHLAVVLHSRGHTVEAIRHLAQALELDRHLVGAEERLAAYRAEQLTARDAGSSLPSGGDECSTQDAA